MPTGIIINCISVVLGGLCGSFVKNRLHPDTQEILNNILGLSALVMAIASIIQMKNMPVVILSVITGTLIGLAAGFGKNIRKAAVFLQKKTGNADASQSSSSLMVTAIVLFCASGTGIYGSLVSGMNGDQSILITKSILDFFTAMIFACTLGKSVCWIAVPQFVIMIALFFLAGLIYPHTTEIMIDDFKACGGMIILATGLRIMKVRDFPIADMIPAMILILPLSWLWITFVLPLL